MPGHLRENKVARFLVREHIEKAVASQKQEVVGGRERDGLHLGFGDDERLRQVCIRVVVCTPAASARDRRVVSQNLVDALLLGTGIRMGQIWDWMWSAFIWMFDDGIVNSATNSLENSVRT